MKPSDVAHLGAFGSPSVLALARQSFGSTRRPLLDGVRLNEFGQREHLSATLGAPHKLVP